MDVALNWESTRVPFKVWGTAYICICDSSDNGSILCIPMKPIRWRVFFAAQVQQWLTAPLSPRPPPLQPTMFHPCPQSPQTQAVTPPWPLKQIAAWTATPLWVHWPAADNVHIQFTHTPTHTNLSSSVVCDETGFTPMELLMLVCRAALLMYSLFLFPLSPYTAVNDCGLKLYH